MNTIELVLCSLGEATATIYHRNRDSQGFPALKKDASDAGATAGKARKVIEADIGESIVSRDNRLALLKKGNGRGKRLVGAPSEDSQTQKESTHQLQGGQKQSVQGQQPSLFDEEEPEE